MEFRSSEHDWQITSQVFRGKKVQYRIALVVEVDDKVAGN